DNDKIISPTVWRKRQCSPFSETCLVSLENEAEASSLHAKSLPLSPVFDMPRLKKRNSQLLSGEAFFEVKPQILINNLGGISPG
ncbi:MAG: hypothetical protein P8Y38_12950, partial [Deltaproteobacteria bacterium]